MTAVGQQYFTANTFEFTAAGEPAAGYQLNFYESGSTTPLAVYSNPGLTVTLLQPVVADANGRFGAIWLSPSAPYKVVLSTAATPDNPTGSQVWTEDPVGPGAGGTISNTAGIVGEVRAFAGAPSIIPLQWLLCAGQAVSRATYADLFAVIGTFWGAGDGSTTFNVPDLRGRALAGMDNLGGTPASRITSGVSGLSGVTLGAAGGSQLAQKDTLVATSGATSIVTPGSVDVNSNTISVLAGPNVVTVQETGKTTAYPVKNLTVDTTVTTTVTSGLTGTTQNVQPTAIVVFMIYAGA